MSQLINNSIYQLLKDLIKKAKPKVDTNLKEAQRLAALDASVKRQKT